MTNNHDITIIGGGIIGLLTAREFFNAGATVAIIEKSGIGLESSWAGGGILLPLYPWRQNTAITQLVLPSLDIYPVLVTELLAGTGIDPEWNPCGILVTKNPDSNTAIQWCEHSGLAFSAASSDLFVGLHTEPNCPLWLPEIAQVRNPRLIKSLKQDLVIKGITFYEDCQLTSVKTVGNRITAINTSAGELGINQLVIATGAWTGDLFRKFFAGMMTEAPKIFPVKGQMILFDAEPGTLPFIVLDGEHYLIPRRDGKILAGSSVEQDGFNKTTTLEMKAKLNSFALDLLPALKDYQPCGHWAGLRPGTEHGIPYIDTHPEITNLSINAGHFRNGLAMGPASAQLLVDLVLQRPARIAAEPYKLSCLH